MKHCPDCKGELERGVIPDSTYGGVFPELFISGESPQPSAFSPFGYLRIKKGARRTYAYRCTKCNRIFQYAEDAPVEFSIAKTLGATFLFAAVILIVVVGVMLIVMFLTSPVVPL